MYKVKYKVYFYQQGDKLYGQYSYSAEVEREYKNMPSVLNRARWAYMYAHKVKKGIKKDYLIGEIYAITTGRIISATKYLLVKRAIKKRKEQNKRDINSLIL